MTNNEIITGIQIMDGIMEDLHTFAVWKSLGYTVKKGEHGIQTRLWRHDSKKKDDEEEGDGFYMCKAYLFKRSQVEPAK